MQETALEIERSGIAYLVCDGENCSEECRPANPTASDGHETAQWYTFSSDGSRRHYCPKCGDGLVQKLRGFGRNCPPRS